MSNQNSSDRRDPASSTQVELQTINILHVRRVSSDNGHEVVRNSYEGRIDISLGVLEDAFWIMLPEMRPILKDMMVEELDEAIEKNRPIWWISPYELCSRFFFDILRPVLENSSTNVIAAQRVCEAFEAITNIYDCIDSAAQDALGIRIFEWLVLEPYKSQLAFVNSSLLDKIITLNG